MPTNPRDIHEAFSLMLAALLCTPPHFIRFDADERDWAERITHLQKLGNAIDAYLKELGRDCSQHARSLFRARCFIDPISDALDDMLGEMERAMEAARLHETTAAD